VHGLHSLWYLLVSFSRSLALVNLYIMHCHAGGTKGAKGNKKKQQREQALGGCSASAPDQRSICGSGSGERAEQLVTKRKVEVGGEGSAKRARVLVATPELPAVKQSAPTPPPVPAEPMQNKASRANRR
jgi:hypothetical protein